MRLGVVAIVLGFAARSEAHWSASSGTSLYTPRYLVCGQRAEHDVRCAGPTRARAQLLADLTGTSPARGGASPEDLARRAAIDAVYFHVTDAIPALRAHLGHAPAPADRGTHRELTLNGLRAEAAYALAHLGDTPSSAAIADLVTDLETTGHGSLWQDTLAALAVIDPPRASRYAIDFLGRTSNWKLSLPGGSSKLKALVYVRREEARAALPVLERLATQTERTNEDHAHCLFMATRVRLDDTLRASVIKQFVGSYSGTWLPLCANDVFAQLGTPSDPDDTPALLRHLGRDDAGLDHGMANLAYQRLLDQLATTTDPTSRALIEKTLVARNLPHATNPTHKNYLLHFAVFHAAALAALGSVEARTRLYAILDDPRDRGHAWLAALWALRLGLPDHANHVGALLLRAPRQAQQETTGIFENIRTRVLDAFVAKYPDDPRWATLVLDLDHRSLVAPSQTAERALYHLSRHPPRLACEAIAEAAAPLTDSEATEFGLLALTTFGDKCRPALARLVDDPRATPQARGSALEILGAIGDPQLAQRIARAKAASKPAVERARSWLRARP